MTPERSSLCLQVRSEDLTWLSLSLSLADLSALALLRLFRCPRLPLLPFLLLSVRPSFSCVFFRGERARCLVTLHVE